MTINELLPPVAALSRAEKFRLAQIILQQLAAEGGTDRPAGDFNPHQFFELAHHRLYGCLKSYANPELIAHEQYAWPPAEGEK